MRGEVDYRERRAILTMQDAMFPSDASARSNVLLGTTDKNTEQVKGPVHTKNENLNLKKNNWSLGPH